MPFFLVALGLVLAASAINGKHRELGILWAQEFTGQGSFLNVALVLFLLGALGAITGLRPVAVAFMSLVLVVMFLTHAGTSESVNFISRIRQQLSGVGGSQNINTPLPQVHHVDITTPDALGTPLIELPPVPRFTIH